MDLVFTVLTCWLAFLFLSWLAGALWSAFLGACRQRRARRAVVAFRRHFN